MGVPLEVRIARINVRQAAPLLRLALREEKARTKAAKRQQVIATEKLRAAQQAEQPARLEAYVNAVFKWCATPKKQQGKAPSASDFGISETKAMRHLFKSEQWQACYWEEPREML